MLFLHFQLPLVENVFHALFVHEKDVQITKHKFHSKVSYLYISKNCF